MREHIVFVEQEFVPVVALEKLLQARIGWVNSVVTPFARASRQASLNSEQVVRLHRSFKPKPSEEEWLGGLTSAA